MFEDFREEEGIFDRLAGAGAVVRERLETSQLIVGFQKERGGLRRAPEKRVSDIDVNWRGETHGISK